MSHVESNAYCYTTRKDQYQWKIHYPTVLHCKECAATFIFFFIKSASRLTLFSTLKFFYPFSQLSRSPQPLFRCLYPLVQ